MVKPVTSFKEAKDEMIQFLTMRAAFDDRSGTVAGALIKVTEALSEVIPDTASLSPTDLGHLSEGISTLGAFCDIVLSNEMGESADAYSDRLDAMTRASRIQDATKSS